MRDANGWWLNEPNNRMCGGERMSHTPCIECGTTNWYWKTWISLSNGEVVCSNCEDDYMEEKE